MRLSGKPHQDGMARGNAERLKKWMKIAWEDHFKTSNL
jgi:hypothetical protein